MKRRLVLHGPSTLTVSLPSKWVKKFNLLKGDEVSVKEQGNELHISLTHKPAQSLKKIVLGENERVGKSQVTSSYRSGFEEVSLVINSPSSTSSIQNLIAHELAGYEVVEQSKNTLTIKYLGNDSSEEFERSFSRVWSLLKDIAREVAQAIQEQDIHHLSELVATDLTINRFTNYCLRILNTHGHPTYAKTSLYYYFVRSIEEIADYYKDFSLSIIASKKFPPPRTVIPQLNEMEELISLIHRSLYHFDPSTVERAYATLKLQSECSCKKTPTHVCFCATRSKIRELLSVIVEISLPN
jgi:phosphate uptake regulator